jgi:hypothetical protein
MLKSARWNSRELHVEQFSGKMEDDRREVSRRMPSNECSVLS